MVVLAWPAGAFAQASRTWVSGVGDDANPCSRTAPCKTFAGAISKTAAGGVRSTRSTPAGSGRSRYQHYGAGHKRTGRPQTEFHRSHGPPAAPPASQLANCASLATARERPLVAPKQDRGPVPAAPDRACPRQNQSRAFRPTVTTTFGPTVWRDSLMARRRAVAFAANRPLAASNRGRGSVPRRPTERAGSRVKAGRSD